MQFQVLTEMRARALTSHHNRYILAFVEQEFYSNSKSQPDRAAKAGILEIPENLNKNRP
jgi:hypothetical protein